MASHGQNTGFHTLDEFVCDAIPSPGQPQVKPTSIGRNAGMDFAPEIVFRAPGEVRATTDDAHKAQVSRVAQGLAAYITASADPLAAVASVRRLLLVELDAIEKSATSRG